ncbi:integrase, partial [Geitlerinema splendidum]|nr:integrase [Geitlerinema splendidum]
MNNLAFHPAITQRQPSQTTEQVLAMWLHGKSPETVSAYSRVAEHLIDFIGKPLTQWTLGDLQRWQDSLSGKAPNTISTYTAIAKSLIGFAHQLGAIPFNVAMPVKAPKSKDCLSQRILSESQVLTMIALESNPRNKLILKTLYYAGLRVSELCNLT